MRRLATGLCSLGLVTSSFAAGSTVREVRARDVSPAFSLPEDLTSPEGKTRWHLESLALGASAIVTISSEDQGLALAATRAGQPGTARALLAGADAERWLLPDRDSSQMKMGARVVLGFDETADGLVDEIQADVATVGIGWVHLPSGPEEVVLQRILLSRRRAGEKALRPDALIHRWVSPRGGVLAEVSGPASTDGRTRLNISSVSVVESVLSGASTLKVYADQLYPGTYIDIKYGWNKGAGTTPAQLVPNPGINNVCDLVNLDSWDFSGVNSGQETASTDVPPNAAETCESARCGYQGLPAGGSLSAPLLERLDSNLTGTVRKDNQVVQREDRAGDVTFWLRAGAQLEGVTGGFGNGESRFCFTDEAGKPRNEAPLWQLAHHDAGGYYTQAGDTWGSVPVTSNVCSLNPTKTCTSNSNCLAGEGTCVCQEWVYNQHCGTNQPFPTPGTLWAKQCTTGGQTYAGKQGVKMVKGGVVTLPSGHTLNALVTRNTTEFCLYTDSACGFQVDKVRTIVYYWQAPYVGSVALVRGANTVDFASGETGETPCTNFTSFAFTDMEYGLLPPISISVGTVTDTSVALSWNPGNDTHRLSAYRIYWDTDSGASSSYAFNSVTNAGQVSFAGTTATISGLAPGKTYYFTVTSLSNFTDPSSGVITTYESIKYPTTVSGDPSFSYPAEVSATTTCLSGGTPALEVTGLTVDRLPAPNVHVCWIPTTDACAVGYDILGSDNATSDAGWSVVGQVGLTNCWDGDPTYILVRARGLTGTGPWGHYLH